MEIINSVIDVADIEAVSLELERLPFSLRDTVDQVASLYAASAHARGLQFYLHVDREVPGWLVGDASRIRQVLVNLLSNAQKFTERGEISIAVVALPGGADGRRRLRVDVRDSGSGVPPDIGSSLFPPSPQAGDAGRGLAVARRLVERMDGEIGYVTESGRGSCFRVEFELDEPAGDGSEASLAGRASPCPGPAEPALDVAVLLRLPGVKGSSASPVLQRLLALFVAETARNVSALCRAAAVVDVATVQALAHKMKSACLAMGAVRLAARARALDLRMKEGDRSAIPDVAAVAAAWDDCRRALVQEGLMSMEALNRAEGPLEQ